MRIGYEGSEGDEHFALLLVYTRVPNGKGVRKLFAERRQIDEPTRAIPFNEEEKDSMRLMRIGRVRELPSGTPASSC
jgi:hypothetical protein